MKNKINQSFFYLPTILWSVFIFIASLLPAQELPTVQVTDKFLHTAVYFILLFLWCATDLYLKSFKIALLQKAAICVVYGFVIEVLQGSLTTTRHFDVYDLVANSLGVLIATVLFYFVQPNKEKTL